MPFSSALSTSSSSSTPQRTTRLSSANSGDSVLSPRQRVPSIIRQIRDPLYTYFGIDRKKVYNEFHFCSECKAFELEKVADPKLTRERNLRKYACQAGHKSFDFPTVKRKHWCWSKCDVEEEGTNDNSINDNQAGRPP